MLTALVCVSGSVEMTDKGRERKVLRSVGEQRCAFEEQTRGTERMEDRSKAVV